MTTLQKRIQKRLEEFEEVLIESERNGKPLRIMMQFSGTRYATKEDILDMLKQAIQEEVEFALSETKLEKTELYNYDFHHLGVTTPVKGYDQAVETQQQKIDTYLKK